MGRAYTKQSARRTRTVPVPEVTARELKEWRLRSGRPDDSEPIDGPMTPNALRLWGTKRLRPAVKAATEGRIIDATVYTLRHSHASACHYVSSFTDVDILRRRGPGVQVHHKHYTHVVETITGTRYENLDELITVARAELENPALQRAQ